MYGRGGGGRGASEDARLTSLVVFGVHSVVQSLVLHAEWRRTECMNASPFPDSRSPNNDTRGDLPTARRLYADNTGRDAGLEACTTRLSAETTGVLLQRVPLRKSKRMRKRRTAVMVPPPLRCLPARRKSSDKDWSKRWTLDLTKGTATPDAPSKRLKNVSIRLEPMMGVVRVAPFWDQVDASRSWPLGRQPRLQPGTRGRDYLLHRVSGRRTSLHRRWLRMAGRWRDHRLRGWKSRWTSSSVSTSSNGPI
jgi:hypothetical protein